MHQLCCMKKVANSVCKMHDFCLKIEEFLLFLTCCFKLTTNHESKFASTCKMCFPNTCKTVLCSGNQFPVKIHKFLFFNFVPFFMELPSCRNKGVLTQTSRNKRERCLLQGLLTQSCRNKGELCMWVSCIDSDPCVHREIHQTRSNGYPFFFIPKPG